MTIIFQVTVRDEADFGTLLLNEMWTTYDQAHIAGQAVVDDYNADEANAEYQDCAVMRIAACKVWGG